MVGGRGGRRRRTLSTTHHGDRLIDARIVRFDLPRLLEVRFSLRQVADLKVEEREPLQRAGVMRRDSYRHVPLVEGALVVALVRQDASVQVVRVGEMRMALEAIHRDAQRGIELPLTAQGLAEPQEHEALRILRELRGQRANVVSHGRTPAPPGAHARRPTAGPPLRAYARRAAPTDPSCRPPRRTGPSRPGRNPTGGAPRRAADRVARRASAPPLPWSRALGPGETAPGASESSRRAAACFPPAPPRRALHPNPLLAAPARPWRRAR